MAKSTTASNIVVSFPLKDLTLIEEQHTCVMVNKLHFDLKLNTFSIRLNIGDGQYRFLCLVMTDQT